MSGLTALGAGELIGLQRRGDVSALEITRACLERVAATDDDVGAFLRLNPRAEDEARQVDAGRRDGALRGVPVAVKDNILTERLETTCGSRMLEGFRPARDATVVARLREQGAVVLGKTNLDEFGMGSSTESSAFGPTRNPWDRTRVPGGSSGGSAAALAAGMAPLALGSDTGGSVRQPAAFCGVVGLKPTYGRVSRSGLVAYGSSLDQVGTIARGVRDAATLLAAIEGEDPADATSAGVAPGDYEAECGRGVAGLRIGLPREYFDSGLHPAVDGRVRAAAAHLERHGARLEEVSLPHTVFAVPTYYLLATAEASSNLARYDGVRYGLRAGGGETLVEMYRSTRAAGFGDEVLRRIMLGTYGLSAGYYDAFYGKAQRVRTLLRRDFEAVFADGVDLLLTPTTPTPPFRLGEKLDDPLAMYLSDVFTATVNLAGLPAISVPAGLTDDGLPVGAQLIGPAFGEARLFRAGVVLEQTFDPDDAPFRRPHGSDA